MIKSTGDSVASVGEYLDGYDYSDTIQRAGENVITIYIIDIYDLFDINLNIFNLDKFLGRESRRLC